MELRSTICFLPFLLLIAGCGTGNNPADELRAVKQEQLDMQEQVVKLYDEDLTYAELQDRKSEIMAGHTDTRKRVKALKEQMPQADFDRIQSEFEVKIEDAKQREHKAAEDWGDRMNSQQPSQ